MLNKPVDDIIMENGKVVGVKSEGEVSLLHSVSVMVSVGLGLHRSTLPSDSGSAGCAAIQVSESWAGDQSSRRSPRSHFYW